MYQTLFTGINKHSAIMSSLRRQENSCSTSSSLDITARTIDLMRSLAEMTMKGSAVVEAGNQLNKRLARGDISEREFEYCAQVIRTTANPNLDGLEIRRQFRRRSSKSPNTRVLLLVFPAR